MIGQKDMCKKVEQMKFVFSSVALRMLSIAFGLTAFKSWYRHYFNTEKPLNYVGPIPDASYYGVKEMSDAEITEVLEWYEGQKSKIFDNMHILE